MELGLEVGVVYLVLFGTYWTNWTAHIFNLFLLYDTPVPVNKGVHKQDQAPTALHPTLPMMQLRSISYKVNLSSFFKNTMFKKYVYVCVLGAMSTL